jgi:hypothetical protein
MALYSAVAPLPVNRIKNRLFDPDARAFILTAGITDRVAKGQINSFVIQAKALGIYNNMVCWLLRSTQNASTLPNPNTAYSLGGLGTFNGTLTNGPTWGTNGISFTRTSSQSIFTDLGTAISSSNFGLFCCADFSELTTSGVVCANRDIFGGVQTKGMAIGATSSTSTRLQFGNGTTNFTQNRTKPSAFACYSQLSNGTNTIQNENTTILASNAPTISGTFGINLQIGAQITNQQFFQGKISFVMAIFGVANNLSIYTLYKNTIGTGLGLP